MRSKRPRELPFHPERTSYTGSALETFMEGGVTTPKVATGILIVRPLLLKAAIPLFLSVTGFVCARIVIAMRKRSTSRSCCGHVSSLKDSMMKAPGPDPAHEIQVDILDDGSLCSDGLISSFTDYDLFRHDLFIEDSQSPLKLQLLSLSSKITDLSERELTLESRFLRYCNLKERESELLEIGHTLQLGRARLDMLHKEVLQMERDSKFHVQVSEACRKVLEEVSYHRRVEKLRLRVKLKKMKQRVEAGGIKLREGRLKMEEKERELVEMRKENEELHKKLSATVEASAKAEEMGLACLRWSNSCLKHELTKNHGQEKQVEPPGASLVTREGDNHAPHSPNKGRPPRIMKKLKQWRGWIGGDDLKA